MNTIWLDDCILYQFYPLGLCGAPGENSWDWANSWNGAAAPTRRIDRILNWVEHLKKLGVTAVLFNPVLQSDRHGYDIRDYYTIDSRLGSNEDFAYICHVLHDNSIRVIIDCIFNYVGRGFWAFRDVLQNRENSRYISWFKGLNFSGNTPMNDGFSYNSYSNHYDMVQLNLENPDVKAHLFGAVRKWVDLFRIDGLRICISTTLDCDFLEDFRAFISTMPAGLGGHIALAGETDMMPDYKALVNSQMLHCVTNYECFMGIAAALNNRNMTEIAYTLDRQFGQNGMYKNTTLLNFLDNHNVTRFSSCLETSEYVRLGYGMLFAMPGSPCLYYGSEWGTHGKKVDGDNALRPAFEKPVWNDLTDFISKLIAARKANAALKYGSYELIFAAPYIFVFARASCGEQVIVAVNISDCEYLVVPQEIKNPDGSVLTKGFYGEYEDILTGRKFSCNGTINLPPCSIQYLKKN